MNQSRRVRSQDSTAQLSRTSGFTLVEVMIAAAVLVIALLGFLGATVRSYYLTAEVRHHDQARALLQSFADEFMRRPVTTGISPNVTIVPFFQDTNSLRTGLYLNWNGISGTETGLIIPLGGGIPNPDDPTYAGIVAEKKPIFVTVTRLVQHIQPSDGTTVATPVITAAGRMISAEFQVTYKANGRQQVESLTILRTNP